MPKRPTLDSLWQSFKDQAHLADAPAPIQNALQQAFKSGVASMVVLSIDLSRMPESEAAIIMHSIMNDFGEYLKSREVYKINNMN